MMGSPHYLGNRNGTIVPMKIINRNFRREFEAVSLYEAGIVLTGSEVKSIRTGNFKLEQSFAKIIDGEAWLFNAEIPVYSFTANKNYQPTRKKKLLLNKKEIVQIETRLKTGGRLTLVPESCYNKGRQIKISLALCKGLGEIAKKKIEMKEDLKRAQEREMKEYVKQ